MSNLELYDRTVEHEHLKSLIANPDVRMLCVTGESGVGKSVLVEKTLSTLGLGEATVSFSFKSALSDDKPPFVAFLLGLYNEVRPSLLARYTYLRPKDIKLKFYVADVTFDFMPEALDGNFLEYLFEHLKRTGVRVLRIENVELCERPEDIKVLSVLGRIAVPHIKIMFEMGTLQDLSDQLKDPLKHCQAQQEPFRLLPLDEGKTHGLYRFVHNEPAPPGVFAQTRGVPLAIEHRADAACGLSWVEDKLSLLSPDQKYLAYATALIDGPAQIPVLRDVAKVDNFEVSLHALIDKRILKDTREGIIFRHPSFQHYLLRDENHQLSMSVHQRLMRHLIDNHQTEQEALSIISIARRLNDGVVVRQFGSPLLKKAYAEQDAHRILFLADALLPWMLPDTMEKTLLEVLRIQSYCLLSQKKAAVIALKALKDTPSCQEQLGPRLTVLEAMVDTLHHRFDASNEKLAEVFADLAPRAAIVALAIQIANDVPLQNEDRAREALISGEALARQSDMSDLEEELARLHAKLSPEPHAAIEMMRDFLSAHKSWSSEIAYARFTHNLGVQELLTTRAEMGSDRLREARTIFEQHGLNFAAYSAVSQSVVEVAHNHFEQAAELLLDGLCLCQEAYDLVSLLNNLGAIRLLQGDYDVAAETLQRALAAFSTDGDPLEDPILLNAVRQNLAICSLKIGNFDAAQSHLDAMPPVSFARCMKVREERLQRISKAICDRDTEFSLTNAPGPEACWMYGDLNVSFLTLSFYDFPFVLIAPEDVEEFVNEGTVH